MKKLGLILLAGVLSLGTFAQTEGSTTRTKAKKEKVKKEPKPIAEVAEKRTNKLTKKLELTDAQTGKVNKIITDSITKKRAIKAEMKGEKEGKKEKLKALNADKKEEFRTVLSAKQMMTFEEMVEAKKARKKAKREQMRG